MILSRRASAVVKPGRAGRGRTVITRSVAGAGEYGQEGPGHVRVAEGHAVPGGYDDHPIAADHEASVARTAVDLLHAGPKQVDKGRLVELRLQGVTVAPHGERVGVVLGLEQHARPGELDHDRAGHRRVGEGVHRLAHGQLGQLRGVDPARQPDDLARPGAVQERGTDRGDRAPLGRGRCPSGGSEPSSARRRSSTAPSTAGSSTCCANLSTACAELGLVDDDHGLVVVRARVVLPHAPRVPRVVRARGSRPRPRRSPGRRPGTPRSPVGSPPAARVRRP